MEYTYILVPIFLSLLIFALTVGYLLFVKYRTNKLLQAIRRRLILERCDPSFAAKPPDVTLPPEPFIGVYREPSLPYVHQSYNGNIYPPSETGNKSERSMGSIDGNSDVIEIPFHSYLPSSSSSSNGMENYYSRSKYQSNYNTIEEKIEDFGDDEPPLQYRDYELTDEVEPSNAYEMQNSSNKYYSNSKHHY